MYKLKAKSLDWALNHLVNYYDSDFFPKPFEFLAIKADWSNIKKHIQSINLKDYVPQAPTIVMAAKPGGTFRAVHQLDPIDSIIYTALLYENAQLIEEQRIPESKKTSCSYRIKPDAGGSFFEKDSTGYDDFLKKAEKYANVYHDGVVLVCDIVDFYNQIFLERARIILSAAGAKNGDIIEGFLDSLNFDLHRGIPVGPAPSILIAEAIMSDIDKKIEETTKSFVQYVDDIHIFFDTKEEAWTFLHSFALYLHHTHRLVLSPDKTKIISIEEFRANYLQEESKAEKDAITAELNDLSGPYPLEESIDDIEELEDPEQKEVREKAYYKLLRKALSQEKIDIGIIRFILRRAGRYSITGIIGLILDNFIKLLPVLRDVIIYFERVLNEDEVRTHKTGFKSLLSNPYIKLPFINMWIYTLFQHEAFIRVSIKIDFSNILRVREQALIAKRDKNEVWLRDIRNKFDSLGPADQRAVLYASSILSKSELEPWLKRELKKNNILNRAVCSYVLSIAK